MGAIIEWLMLLMLCTTCGAESGGSWQRQVLAEGDEGSWGSNNGGECWGGASWQQQAQEGSQGYPWDSEQSQEEWWQ